jgi:hypothetical protein
VTVKGLPQINFGLLGDRESRPVAVRVKPQKPLPNRQELRSSAMLSEPAKSSSPLNVASHAAHLGPACAGRPARR